MCVCFPFITYILSTIPFYASIFLNCYGKILLFYVLTSVALLNIVIDTSAFINKLLLLLLLLFPRWLQCKTVHFQG